MSAPERPFAAPCYQLAMDLEARPLRDGAARAIAARLAAMEPWRALGSTVPGLERYLTACDLCLHRYVLWRADQPIGVVAVRAPWLHGGFLELLGVFEEAQGQGVGRTVVEWLKTAGGGNNLWTTVSVTNPRARRFYERLGFVPIGELPDLLRAGRAELLLRLPMR